MTAWSDLAFTDAVKATQTRYATREICKNYERNQRPAALTGDLVAFLQTRVSIYLATASAQGRPYIQHRGGPPGFVKVLDDHTLAFADYPGNKQFITAGNLSENNRAFLFAMEYATRTRIKFWGRAEIVEDPDLVSALSDNLPPLKQTPERALKFTVEAWDLNCRKHIPQLFSEDDVRRATEKLTGRITELEAEIARLQSAGNG